MKTWLTEFKISNALNNCGPLPPAIEQAMIRSEEARRFAENSRAVARALKSQLPRPKASAPFHATIMRAVRAAGRAPAAENRPGWPRWIAVSSIVLLVLSGVFWGVHFSSNPGSAAGGGDSQTSAAVIARRYRGGDADAPTLADAGSALELGGLLVRGTPATALSPLRDEMGKLDRDLATTERFLLASLP